MSANAQPARVLGIPLGEIGLFPSLFLALAVGFMAFFASCFLAILSLLVWNTATHGHISYVDTYRYVALPTGVAVMVMGMIWVTGSWLRRKFAGGN
ncbi:MAG: hypothetical protein WCA44_13080 [Acidobacteriaceae bacterium]|jgi:hypothetical protein